MTPKGLYTRLDKSGQTRWYVRIVVDGVLQRFAPHGGFATEKAAATFLKHARADIERGKFFPDKFKHDLALPLGELLLEQARSMTASPNTKNDRAYQAWWVRHYGHLDARLLTTAHLAQAEHRLTQERKGPQTVHHYMKFLRHRLALALQRDQIERSPFQKTRLKPVHNMRTRFYSRDERERLYRALDPEWRDAAELAGLTGLRWREQFHLTRAQIHLAEGFVELPSTKSGRPQARILNARAKALIARQLARHDSDYLYPSGTNVTPLDYSNFRKKHWAPACKAAGIKNAKWNDWRHTFASDLTMAGHSDRTVAHLLGHTSTTMVKRYAHLADAHLRQAVESVATPLPTRKWKNVEKKRK